MLNSEMKKRIPENFKRRIVACVSKALTDDLHLYLSTLNPDTKNGVPHNIGDWINTNIQRDIASEYVDILEFPRYSWRGKIIIDRANLFTFTVMREKRLRFIRKEKRERPHYLQTIVAELNSALEAPVKQMGFFSTGVYKFDRETLETDYNSIFNGCLEKDEGFTHCVITYDTIRGELADVNMLFLDKDLDEVERISLKEYIKPDFAALTNTYLTDVTSGEPESKASDNLISLKSRTADIAISPARLREVEKHA